MEFLNKVELKGIVGRTNFQQVGERKYYSLSVVTEYSYKDRNGCAIIETTWWSCKAYDSNVPSIGKVKRGDKVHLLGRLYQSKYHDDALSTPMEITEIIVQSLEIIG